jgi:uncharacterized membrane protein
MAFDPLAFDEFAERVLLFGSFSFFAWIVAFALRSIEEKRPRRPGPLLGPWLPWYGAMAVLDMALHGALAGILPDWALLVLLLSLPVAADFLWKGFACPRLGITWRDRSGDLLSLKGAMSLRSALCWIGYILACLYAVEPALVDTMAGMQPRIKDFAAGFLLACLSIDAAIFLRARAKTILTKRSTRP